MQCALTFPPPGLSLRWFQAFFASDAYFNALVHVSLPLGLVSAIIATLCETLAALALSRFSFPGRDALQRYIISLLVIPHSCWAPLSTSTSRESWSWAACCRSL